MYESLGRYEEAESLLRRAIYEKVFEPENRYPAAIRKRLDELGSDSRALTTDEKTPEPGHPSVAAAPADTALPTEKQMQSPETSDSLARLPFLIKLAEVFGGHEGAEPICKRILAIREKYLGTEHPDVAASLIRLADLYNTLGRYEEAEPLLKRALAIKEKVSGSEHLDVAAILEKMALLYESLGRYEEAEDFFRRALVINEKVSGLSIRT